MTPELAQYLEQIRQDAKLDHEEESGVLSELEAHIQDRVEELVYSGLSEEEALRTCLDQMGSTRLVARQIYEAHSQGTWKQVLLAVLPHLLFGILFALNWWSYPGWLVFTLLLTLATVIYGWWNGKPNWIFSWLGASLVPVLALGILLLYLPRIWTLLTLLFYFPLALWWVFRIMVETTRRDWIFGSMAFVPLPIIGGWYLAVMPEFQLTADTFGLLETYAPWIALSFLALAITIAAIIRIRRRSLRIAFLIVSGVMTMSWVGIYLVGGLGITTFIGLMLVMWGVFLFPPIMEKLIRKGRASLWKPQYRHLFSRGKSGTGS